MRLMIGACAFTLLSLGAQAGETGVVLNEESIWRAAFRMETPVVRSEKGLEPASTRTYHSVVCTSPAIPAGWTAAEFDDSEWPRWRPSADRGRGSREVFNYGFTNSGASSPAVAAIYMRGRFVLPAAAPTGGLKLSLAYRGGAVVYVNGREVARGHLPALSSPNGHKDAVLAPDAVADDYPPEVFLKENKQPIREDFGDPGKYKAQLEKRIRTLEAVLDPKLLKPGVNLVAVELRRAPYVKGVVDKDGLNYRCGWGTCGLVGLALTGSAGAVSAPPGGVQVWNHPTGQALDASWLGDAGSQAGTIRLVGARNGAFSGQVVVSAVGDLKGVKASASELKNADNGSVIPAAAVQIRYGLPAGKPPAAFDGLEEAASADAAVDPAVKAAVQPVWTTVRVPRDAKPGRYSGTLTVEANGRKAAEVPLEISVADWTIPDSKEYKGFLDVVDSPQTLALKYGVPMWSEAHWKLIDRNFELMGQLGAKCLYLVLLPQTYFGNEHSMLHSVKQADGSYRHDFSVVDRYLDAALKHMGRPEVVVADIWDRRFGHINYRNDPEHDKPQEKGVAITLKDPSGGLSVGEGPKWGTPEALAFWKPVVEGLKERLTKRGIGGSLVWGLASDRRPRKETVEDLKALAPEVPWSCHSHPKTSAIHGQPVRYIVHVWGCPQINHKALAARHRGWEADPVLATFPRMSSGGVGSIYNGTSPLKYRAGIEGMMVCGYRGLGRVGGEFWALKTDKRGRASTILRTTPDVGETWGIGFECAILSIFAPGRDGPVATARSEMFRENQQEIEARVLLEKALKDPAQKARMGEALAMKCQAVLDARGQAMLAGDLSPGWLYYQQGLRERAAQLYAAAAEVAGRTGGE